MIHLFYTEANKNSDTPSFVTPIEAKNEVRAAARHAELMEDLEEAGFTLGNNYLPPVLTTCADDVQLPALNEPSYEFVEKFQLVDGVWQTPEEIRFVIPTTQPVDYRYTALWVYTSSVERLTPQQDAAVKAQLLSVGGVFGLLRDATISREDVQLYNYKTLDLLIRAQEKVFINTDKPATKEYIEEFTAQCCSLLSSKADPSGIDSIISTWVKKQSSQIIEEEKDKPKQKRASSKKSEYEIMEVDTALSITGVNPAESKAAQVKVAKALIDNRDSAWRAITSKFRVIPGITDVEREVRHDIVQGILKNLKIIDDSSALLHFIKTQLSDHPACPELAGYAASNEEEKPEVGTTDNTTNINYKTIRAAVCTVLNGETTVISNNEVEAFLEAINITKIPLGRMLAKEISSFDTDRQLTDDDVHHLVADVLENWNDDQGPRLEFIESRVVYYIADHQPSDALNVVTKNEVATTNQEKTEHKTVFPLDELLAGPDEKVQIAECDKSAKQQVPTIEELQAEVQALKAHQQLFSNFVSAGVKFLLACEGGK